MIFCVNYSFKLSKEWRKQLLRLSKMLRHRGPDWNGIHSFRNCILAHERLSINGLHSGTLWILNRNQLLHFRWKYLYDTVLLDSPPEVLRYYNLLGAQPIKNKAQNIALSVNGEIYNHLELLEELKEIVPNIQNDFTTDSDCEVLLHLYKVQFVKQYIRLVFCEI